MAQGVRIFFFDTPEEGNRVKFFGIVNGIQITYNNGLNVIDFEYTNNDSEVIADPLHRVKIGATNEETALNTKAFLDNNGYQTTTIPIYNQVLNETYYIVVSNYTSNEVISFDIDSDSDNIVINSFGETQIPTTAPKYFFQYKGITGIEYKCEIYQKQYVGSSAEITGRVFMDKADVNDHLDIFRGSGLTLILEANINLSFEDLYLQNDNDYTVKFYISNSLMYQGFLKPDGVFESWTDEIWNITLQCTDRLGDLENLSFVDSNGFPFSGKMSILNVVRNVLNRTGLQLKINTFCDVFYYGVVQDVNTDSLAETYINVDRFIKPDDNTIMSCKEVLESIARIFNLAVTQQSGEWFIYRVNDMYNNTYPYFKRYEINGNYIGLSQLNTNQIIGSQIDNYYPHHCNKNQKIEIKGAVSAFRLGYKYGFIQGINKNGNFTHTPGLLDYNGWDVLPFAQSKNSGYLIIDPLSSSGVSFKAAVVDIGETYNPEIALTNTVDTQELEEGYSFEFKTRFKSYGFPAMFRFDVILYPTDLSAPYSLNKDGSWSLILGAFDLLNEENYPNSNGDLVNSSYERTFSISSAPLPKTGTIDINIYAPFKSFGSPTVLVELKSLELINTFSGNNVVGEFHTVSRINPVSSNVRENESVSNGDNENTIYSGAFYMQDEETLTKNWYREKFAGNEVKPILRISSEDELRMFQKPLRIFSGDLFGRINYITSIKINNIDGVFMPISWKFDTFNNVLSLKSMELYSPELYDIKYEKTFDYGETVKPTIIG